MTDTF